MPLYEFRCSACGGQFERFCLTAKQGEEEQSCPSCGAEGARRVLSRPGSVGATSGASASCGPASSPFS